MDQKKVDTGIELIDSMTDEELNKLTDYVRFALADRARRRNARALATIDVGTRVRLAGNYKPAYLTGLTGKVVEKKQSRVLVQLDCGPIKKFRSGKVLTSAGSLEVIK